NRLSIRADVIGLKENFGRCEVGVLLDWQPTDGDDTDDHHQDGNDDCNDRVIDEKSGHSGYLVGAAGAGCASAVVVSGFGLTVKPPRTFWTPSADSLTRLQSLLDDPVRPCLLANLNRTDLNFVIAADDGYLIVTLQFTNGFLRNQQRASACRYNCANAGVLAGTKHISGVREETLNAQCTGFDIDLAVNQSSLPFVGINQPIGQNQLQAQMALIFIGVFFNVVQVFPLAHREVDFNGINGGYGCE